jgi:hypothetical protein
MKCSSANAAEGRASVFAAALNRGRAHEAIEIVAMSMKVVATKRRLIRVGDENMYYSLFSRKCEFGMWADLFGDWFFRSNS